MRHKWPPVGSLRRPSTYQVDAFAASRARRRKTIIPTTRVRRPHAHSSMNVPRTTVYGHLNTRTRAASSSAVPVNMVGCGPCCGDAVAADLPLRLRAEHQSRRRPPTRGPSWFGHRPISLRPVRTAAGLRCRVRGVRRRAESSPAISPRPPTVVMVFPDPVRRWLTASGWTVPSELRCPDHA